MTLATLTMAPSLTTLPTATLGMSGGMIGLSALGVLAGVIVAAVLFVMLLIPVFKGIGWVLARIFRFIGAEFSDVFRMIGAILLSVVYGLLIILNIIIMRWSAATHFGRALTGEVKAAGLCVYRMVVGHPARLFGLGGLTEGLEHRLPEVVRAAPASDGPSPRTGQFEGYRIVGSLAGGGSGAKLYIASPDSVKMAAFGRQGLRDVSQVVIKSFSLAEGSSLPQIVRESRSLDAAKRMGLILDHELSQHRFYYVMRYVPGDSLSVVTRRLHAASPAEGLAEPQLRLAVGYACDLVRTLSDYHKGGLWHKDVKPDNIIVDGGPNPHAHLVDFGLVSSLRSAMTLTTHGTEYFRDPELVRQALKGAKVHEIDGARFDVYGAGAVLYSIVEDSFPAHGVLSQVTKRCPETVKWIIRRAMTDYDKRYATAEQMLADLNVVARAADPYAVRPVDLPSMSGAEHEEAAVAAAAFAGSPVLPREPVGMAGMAGAVGMAGAAAAAGLGGAAHAGMGAAGAAAAAGASAFGRGAPKIRMVNWWSGRAAVDGGAATPPGEFGERVERFTEQSVRHARQAVQSVWKGVRAGVGDAREAAAAAERSDWTPPTGPRASARDQIASARERVRAARARAQARTRARWGSTMKPRSAGIGGVAVAVVVCLGMTGMVMNRSMRPRHPRVVAAAPTPEQMMTVWVNGKETNINSRTVQVPAGPSRPAHVRVMVINDVRRPWSSEVMQPLVAALKGLQHENIEMLGEAPDAASAATDVDAAAKARLVLDSEQVPVDSVEAPRRFEQYFSDASAEVDAVLWVMAPVTDTGEARMHLFVPPSSIGSTRTKLILAAMAETPDER